ncbi:hypothetical protein [Pontibacter actiniarum]|uniref:Transmembrane protein n=1 Tax=Pontibacter actiniarum TaxID=323450 RepID=A0A1X9YQW7_9BACT|nr:hypothetical protein [Pontibacter actiniarum]ARS35267.1 hypothetical protein CA264_07340 [Pontibacter actiniarum]
MTHPYFKKLFFIFLLLFCSCVTERKAKEYFEEHPEQLAAYVDKNEAYTEEYGAAYAAKHFPGKKYPPDITPKPYLAPGRLSPYPAVPEEGPTAAGEGITSNCPVCKPERVSEIIYVEDTSKLDALRVMLDNERSAYNVVTQQLRETETERDYWQEQNRKKFWALIAMAVFAVLYILFRVLASRIRTT